MLCKKIGLEYKLFQISASEVNLDWIWSIKRLLKGNDVGRYPESSIIYLLTNLAEKAQTLHVPNVS